MASLAEQRDAYRRGLNRAQAARGRGQQHTHGYEQIPEAKRLDFDGMSAVAEMLVAEATGREWINRDAVTPDDPLAGDVDGGLQVRWTEHASGHLIVYEEDSDVLTAVLAVGRAPKMIIVGFINVMEAKTPFFWRQPPQVRAAAYWVPQDRLLDIYLLRKATWAAAPGSRGSR